VDIVMFVWFKRRAVPIDADLHTGDVAAAAVDDQVEALLSSLQDAEDAEQAVERNNFAVSLIILAVGVATGFVGLQRGKLRQQAGTAFARRYLQHVDAAHAYEERFRMRHARLPPMNAYLADLSSAARASLDTGLYAFLLLHTRPKAQTEAKNVLNKEPLQVVDTERSKQLSEWVSRLPVCRA
jgi:hypothetical protein